MNQIKLTLLSKKGTTPPGFHFMVLTVLLSVLVCFLLSHFGVIPNTYSFEEFREEICKPCR